MSRDGYERVSIILPSFNCATTIEKAILSVLDQDYDAKELIIVDAGSTDGTIGIIQKYKESIAHYLSEPDKGVYDAMNKGIGLATGEWIYFLGADDRLFDNTVLSRALTRTIKSRIIYGNVLLSGEGPVGKNAAVYDGEFTELKLCCKSMCQQSIFYRKNIFNEFGTFDLKYEILADWAFNIKVFSLLKEKPLFINEMIAVYNTEGLSGTRKDLNFIRDRMKLIRNYYGLHYVFLSKVFLFSRKSPLLFKTLKKTRSLISTVTGRKV